MMTKKERCNMCGKWVASQQRCTPTENHKLDDGSYGICLECATKYDEKYRIAWLIKKVEGK